MSAHHLDWRTLILFGWFCSWFCTYLLIYSKPNPSVLCWTLVPNLNFLSVLRYSFSNSKGKGEYKCQVEGKRERECEGGNGPARKAPRAKRRRTMEMNKDNMVVGGGGGQQHNN
jgi:hypothetical protein